MSIDLYRDDLTALPATSFTMQSPLSFGWMNHPINALGKVTCSISNRNGGRRASELWPLSPTLLAGS